MEGADLLLLPGGDVVVLDVDTFLVLFVAGKKGRGQPAVFYP